MTSKPPIRAEAAKFPHVDHSGVVDASEGDVQRGQVFVTAERLDASVADKWGKTVALREAAGRPIGVMDAFIAATAEAHALTLVTRNVSDFEESVKTVINPWTG